MEALGGGRFIGQVHERWFIVRGPNGGYVGAIILRALREAVGDHERAARSLTIHYLRAPGEGHVEIETTLERVGRSLTTVSARASQGGETFAIALAAFSKPREGPELAEAVMPEAPSPEESMRLVGGAGPAPLFVDNFDVRWAIGDPPFSGSDRALVGGWIRLPEPRRVDDLLATQYTDAFPPPVFSRLAAPPAYAPTVDLTVHFREPLPAPDMADDDYVLATFRSRLTHQGFFEEDGELWSPGGRLLVQSRQLGLLLVP